jgi:hypothetical protein
VIPGVRRWRRIMSAAGVMVVSLALGLAAGAAVSWIVDCAVDLFFR